MGEGNPPPQKKITRPKKNYFKKLFFLKFNFVNPNRNSWVDSRRSACAMGKWAPPLANAILYFNVILVFRDVLSITNNTPRRVEKPLWYTYKFKVWCHNKIVYIETLIAFLMVSPLGKNVFTVTLFDQKKASSHKSFLIYSVFLWFFLTNF